MEKKALPAAGKGPSAISIYHFLNIGKMHLFKFGAKNFACSGTNPTCISVYNFPLKNGFSDNCLKMEQKASPAAGTSPTIVFPCTISLGKDKSSCKLFL